MGMFDFIADRGGYTYEDVQRRRDLVDTLSNTGSPTTLGGGISAIAGALGAVMGDRRADRAEEKRAAEADSVFEAALNGMPQSNPGLAGALVGGGATFSPAAYEPTGDALRDGIVETANAIGADPIDLATAISYETAGTFDPTKAGPTTQWGQHRGLIQFGEPQAQQHGVDWSDPMGSQLGADGAIASYFRSSGFKPGMSGLDLYSTINAGAPGRYSASDANNGGAPGSVADKWNNQMGDHRQKAAALLGGSYTPAAPQSSGGISIPAPAPVNVSLIRAMSNPYLSPEQKQILGGIMAQQQAQQITPYQMAQLQMQQQQIAQAGQITPYQQAQMDMQRGQNEWERERYKIDSQEAVAIANAEANKRPAPFTDAGKLQADLDAGYISQNVFDATLTGTGKSEKDMTEAERRIFMFSNIQQQTSPVIDKIETAGFDPSNMQDRFANGVLGGNWIRSQEGQQYRAAASSWAEGALRLATGAAATPEEHDRIMNTYFAQAGDSPETVRFKQQMRHSYEQVLRATLNGDISAEIPNPMLIADEAMGGGSADISDDDLLKKYGG